MEQSTSAHCLNQTRIISHHTHSVPQQETPNYQSTAGKIFFENDSDTDSDYDHLEQDPSSITQFMQLDSSAKFDDLFEKAVLIDDQKDHIETASQNSFCIKHISTGIGLCANVMQEGKVIRSGLSYHPYQPAPTSDVRIKIIDFLRRLQNEPQETKEDEFLLKKKKQKSHISLFVVGGLGTSFKTNPTCKAIRAVLQSNEFASCVSLERCLINPWKVHKFDSLDRIGLSVLKLCHMQVSLGMHKGKHPVIADESIVPFKKTERFVNYPETVKYIKENHMSQLRRHLLKEEE